MNLKAIVCILLVAAVPMYAQAQSPSAPKVNKGDAEKVIEVRKSALACEPVEPLQKLRSIQLICVGGQRSVLPPLLTKLGASFDGDPARSEMRLPAIEFVLADGERHMQCAIAAMAGDGPAG